MSARVAMLCPRAGDDDGATTVIAAESSRSLPQALRCAQCGDEHPLHRERVVASGGVDGCVACGHLELFTQKDFPRALGIAIVVLAAVLAPFTWYASLAVAAVLDALLYRFAPNVVICYVCGAQHRGFPDDPRHPGFDREIDERLKFGARAVMGKPMRPGGTAGAPEPKH